jgi:hypothetical protein
MIAKLQGWLRFALRVYAKRCPPPASSPPAGGTGTGSGAGAGAGTGSGTGAGGGPGQPLAASINGSATETNIFVDDSATNVSLTGGAQGGSASYSFDWNFGDGSSHSSAQSPGHVFPVATDLTTGKRSYQVVLKVTDANGATATATGTVTVLCGAGAHVVSADLRVCGHWNPSTWPTGKTIAKVRYMPAPGQTWQFSGAFNVYENTDPPGCPTATTTLIECTGPKTGNANPTNHFGGIFGTNPPAANGQVIRAQAVAADGTILETQDITVT